MTEIYALDLDWDLVNHLSLAESIDTIQRERVHPDLIQDPDASKVFRWQLDHIREYGTPATASVLENQFLDVTISDPLAVIEDLIFRLRERYIRNKGRDKILRLAEMSLNDPLSVAGEMVKEGRELAEFTRPRGEVFGTGDFNRLITAYDKNVLAGRGPSFGFEEVDEHFFGQVGLTYLIAPPKTYKSWLVINAALDNIMEGKFPYIYSLELPARETTMRLLCMASGVPFWRYLRQSLDQEHTKLLKEASELLDEAGVYRIEKPQHGDRGVQSMITRAREAGADVVYLDQLQYMENRNGYALGSLNDTKDYFAVNDELRNLSDDGPIFVAHQFNRTVMNADAMPSMQQVKASSSIEEVSTLALGIWANKDMRQSGVFELGTLASRNSMYGTWEIGVDFTHNCQFQMLGSPDG